MDLGNLYDAEPDDGNWNHLQQPYPTQFQQNQELGDIFSHQNDEQFTPANAPEGNSSMDLHGAPPDQIYYLQLMETNSSITPLNNQQAMDHNRTQTSHLIHCLFQDNSTDKATTRYSSHQT